MAGPVIFVVTRNANGLYRSDDQGATFTQVLSNALTSEVTDIAVGDYKYKHSVITYGDGIATTPYYSLDNGATYQAGQNTVGKEVTFVGKNTYVFGSVNSTTASGSGSILEMSFDEGQTIGATMDVSVLFNYSGAIFSDIKITSFDFTNNAGGYITIAGDNYNSSADQILTRTFNRGQSFPDALILPGSTGIIRAVWTSPERNVVFAIGEPDTVRGVLYSINPSLTEAPVKVLDGIKVGSITNDSTTKFASVPPTYNPDWNLYEEPPGLIAFRSKVYFLDSDGKIYYSDDYGFTWQFRSQIAAVCVDIIALSETTVIVLTKSPVGIFKSVDGGRTFTENPQSSWIDPKAISSTITTDCDTCNQSFAGNPNAAYTCFRSDRLIGTLCKPPYVFSDVFQACVKPSTIVPTNLILSLDYSQSVSSTERFLFKSYIQLLLTKLEDRLIDQSMQIAVIGWSSEVCLQQDFTSDINLLRIAVDTNPPGSGGIGCFETGTNHSAEFCFSLRAMHNQSILRPDAENVIVVFTDGNDGVLQQDTITRGCDLSDIGILPVVPSDLPAVIVFDQPCEGNWKTLIRNPDLSINPNTMYSLIKNAKTQLNNNTGVKIMVVALGSTGERADLEDFMINEPKLRLGVESIVPSSVPNTSNPYYFDGGTFDTAEFIADQIRLGLAAEIVSSPTCPNGCTSRPGINGLGYCECYEQYAVDRCSFIMENCTTGETVVMRSKFLPAPPGKIITLKPKGGVDTDPFFYDGGTGCWLVTDQITDEPFFNIRPGDVLFNDCPTCLNPNWYKCTDCLENTFSVYTRNAEFQKLLDNGENVITHTNYPDRCLLIENIGALGTYTESGITISGINFRGPDCPSCPRAVAVNYRLTDCSDETNIIYCQGLTNDLSLYMGQYVNLEAYGSTCWFVALDFGLASIYQDVVVTQSYPTCPACLPAITYEFINCENENIAVYTRQDFSQYVGQRIRLQEYPGSCWTCTDTTISPATVETLTIDGLPFEDCPSCLVTYYQLTNVVNPDVFLISSSTELARYLGRIITVAGYPGLCFKVTLPLCDCIRATINGVEYDAYPQFAQFNGRNVYYITTDTQDELAIAWSINPNRWELFNRSTSEILGFSTTDTECPFSNFWTIQQGSPYIITRVSFCADRIYNISPELDFNDSASCTNCI